VHFQAAAAKNKRSNPKRTVNKTNEEKETARVAEQNELLDQIAELLKSKLALKRPCVTILSGSGMSVAAGHQPFRGSGGIFETMKPELMTASPAERDMMRKDTAYVNTLALFEKNPLPFLELWRSLILYHQDVTPTFSHRFIQVLYNYGATRQQLACI
jgi:NAD-dependent SIR2 family protein deacetylase